MPKLFTKGQAVETTPRPPIPLHAIKAERVASCGYDSATQTLAVQFKPQYGKDSPIYHYPEITPEQFATFTAPETAGSLTKAGVSAAVFKKYPAEPIPE